MYRKSDWKTVSYSTDEIVRKIKASKRVVEYKLNKLAVDFYLQKVKSYPVFWKCMDDEKLRAQIDSEYVRVLRDLLGEIGEE